MNMAMSKEEILRDYRTAKNKAKQVEILAYLSGITGTETEITAENVRVMNGVAVLMKK